MSRPPQKRNPSEFFIFPKFREELESKQFENKNFVSDKRQPHLLFVFNKLNRHFTNRKFFFPLTFSLLISHVLVWAFLTPPFITLLVFFEFWEIQTAPTRKPPTFGNHHMKNFNYFSLTCEGRDLFLFFLLLTPEMSETLKKKTGGVYADAILIVLNYFRFRLITNIYMAVKLVGLIEALPLFFLFRLILVSGLCLFVDLLINQVRCCVLPEYSKYYLLINPI